MPATAGTILRREHLVAACLVGTVVVVVGFASGIGLTKPAATQNTAMPPMSQGTEPDGPATGDGAGGGGANGGGSAPVNYVGTPIGLAAAPAAGSQGLVDTTAPPTSGVPPTTSETAPPPTTTTAPGSPPPTCDSGVLTVLLDQAATAVNGVPVIGPLTPQITDALVGSCSAQSTVAGSTPAASSATTPPVGSGLLPLLGPVTGTGS